MSAIGGFVLDATVTEDHVQENEATEEPVEQGAAITDHIRQRAGTLTLECVVSNTPMGDLIAIRSSAAAMSSAVQSLLPSAQPVNPYTTIVDEARGYMAQLMTKCEPVVVETATKIYDSMALLSIRENRTSGGGDSFRFTASFRQIRIVTNDRATVKAKIPLAKKKKKRGSKPASSIAKADTSVSPEDEARIRAEQDEKLQIRRSKRQTRDYIKATRPGDLTAYDEMIESGGGW